MNSDNGRPWPPTTDPSVQQALEEVEKEEMNIRRARQRVNRKGRDDGRVMGKEGVENDNFWYLEYWTGSHPGSAMLDPTWDSSSTPSTATAGPTTTSQPGSGGSLGSPGNGSGGETSDKLYWTFEPGRSGHVTAKERKENRRRRRRRSKKKGRGSATETDECSSIGLSDSRRVLHERDECTGSDGSHWPCRAAGEGPGGPRVGNNQCCVSQTDCPAENCCRSCMTPRSSNVDEHHRCQDEGRAGGGAKCWLLKSPAAASGRTRRRLWNGGQARQNE